MKKYLALFLILSSVLMAQNNQGMASDPWHPGPVYHSYTTERTGKGAARAAGAGNRAGITMAQIGTGVLVGALVTVIATIVCNSGGSSSHSH